MTKLADIFNEAQRQYWYDRQIATFNSGEKDALKLAKQLKTQYEKAIENIEKEINAFYGKYQRETGFDMRTIKKLLDRKELKSFNEQLDEFIKFAKKNKASPEFIEKLRLLRHKAYISRLQDLETNIAYEIAKLSVKNRNLISSALTDIYEDSYYKNIFNFDKFNGFAVSFATPNLASVTKYLANGFSLGNYSVGEFGIWQNVIKLSNILETKIPQGLILGQNPKKVASIASKQLGTDYNNTVRLVRTEYNYILNQATKDSYKSCGVDRYQILVALDERTCDGCGPLDLLIEYYSNIEVGLNYPPFHPNCRCTTIPYFEPDEFDEVGERIAKDKNGNAYMVPADLTFNEWKAGLTEHKGGVMYFSEVIK